MTRANAAADRVDDAPTYDSDAEERLLELVNAERAQAGESALALDQGLTSAARIHAELMAEQGTLTSFREKRPCRSVWREARSISIWQARMLPTTRILTMPMRDSCIRLPIERTSSGLASTSSAWESFAGEAA
ncbi:MAG TPA: CAP domain-containing protein, partial [Terriglobales bacterium]